MLYKGIGSRLQTMVHMQGNDFEGRWRRKSRQGLLLPDQPAGCQQQGHGVGSPAAGHGQAAGSITG